jgi:hypothetical protein
MSTKSRFREGNGDCPRQFENGMVLSIGRPLAAFSSAKAASSRKPLNLNKMTKQQLIEKVAAKTELKKSEVEVAVDAVLT